ncbi:hypothetical protein WJX84_011080 [Apatococcus fuscideae]|uniref:Uncharacterized protein n=1 Tax=Apatococcus fuscideae TaxID=2026836 RepID=A0AAW1T2U0_9CHLO
MHGATELALTDQLYGSWTPTPCTPDSLKAQQLHAAARLQHRLLAMAEVELDCTALAFGGQGVCRQDSGFVIFCNAAFPGEKLIACITAIKRGHAVATKLRTLQAHDHAVSAPCPHFGPCGGCTLQNLEYAAQLTAKREWVVSALQRIGGFSQAESLVTSVIPCRDIFRYRNNMRFSFGPKGGSHFGGPDPDTAAEIPPPDLALGLHPRGSGTTVLPVSTCHLQHTDADKILQIMNSWLQTLASEPQAAAAPASSSSQGTLEPSPPDAQGAASHSKSAAAPQPSSSAAAQTSNERQPRSGFRAQRGRRGGQRGGRGKHGARGSLPQNSPQGPPQQFLQELVMRQGLPEGGKPTFMVDIITSYHAPDRLQSVLRTIQEQVPTVKTLVNTVAATPRSRNVKTYPISGPHFLRQTLCGLDFRVSPRSFFQTNTRQTEMLYSTVALMAGLKPAIDIKQLPTGVQQAVQQDCKAEGNPSGSERPVLWDIFCGVGTIGLSLASQCSKVIGIDGAGGGITDAGLNAHRNSIHNAAFFQHDLAAPNISTKLESLPQPDIVITDPARAGMTPAFLAYLRNCGAARIVYVSCDPSSQARDIRQLTAKDNGGAQYQLMPGIVPCDMFPHTAHIESVALLTKL